MGSLSWALGNRNTRSSLVKGPQGAKNSNFIATISANKKADAGG